MKQDFVKAYFGNVLNCQCDVQFAVWACQPLKLKKSTKECFWTVNGEEHRLDGPAFKSFDGNEIWSIHGRIHREDGPAVINSGGTKQWYFNGKLHREDGPAIEYEWGRKEWYLNGARIK